MASQRRERASSDRAQPGVVPQRPGLQSRTISAPPGGLYKLDPPKTAMEGGSNVGRTLVEEDEDLAHGEGSGVSSPQVGNEVWFRFVELVRWKYVPDPQIISRRPPDRISRM